jgi:ABC-type glycerol-3-phosphate transport system substrate-binding protein
VEEALPVLTRVRLPLVLLILCSTLAGACGRSGEKPTTAASGAGAVPTPPPAGSSPQVPEPATGTIDIWTFPQGDDEKSIKAYIAEFKKRYPQSNPKLLVIPEGDPYFQKVNTGLRGRKPPDVAIIEDRAWMKSGKVVELTAYYASWGLKVADFNPGGLARAAVEGDVTKGVYAVGDYLGGNVLFYNKKMFDAAGVAHPPVDRSLTIQEYVDICRKLAKPDPNPAKTVYGCSMPEWGFGIQTKDVFGSDGKHAQGAWNSPEMVEAWNIGSAVVRDKLAPLPSQLEAASESDLFAQGRMGITWSDFTEANKYKENKIDFGLAPFFVIRQGESFVDTWTAPWGTFKEAKNPKGALAFLYFLATEAQKLRVQTSPDPPLSTRVAQEQSYGQGDAVKEEYLKVLQSAKPQVFVPPGIDTWDPLEVLRQMTVGKKTDAKPILDAMAQKMQKEQDETWPKWEKLSGG